MASCALTFCNPAVSRIHEDKKLAGRHFELKNRFIYEQRLNRITLRPHHGVLVMLVFLERLRMKNLLFEMVLRLS